MTSNPVPVGLRGVNNMDLILWRHAQAQEWVEGCDDMARKLTSRGEKQATRMANWLDRQLPENTRVLVSPARRTEQTAMALNRKYKIRLELAPSANVTQLLELVRWNTRKGTVLVVGHQPTLGQTIAQLVGFSDTECAVRKGAIWWLRSRERGERTQTIVVAVQSPEFL